MAYTTTSKVKTLAQIEPEDLGYEVEADYDAFLDSLIVGVEHYVNGYCRVPDGFFDDSGLEFSGVLFDYSRNIQLPYYPVLSISNISVNTAGYGQTADWSTLDSTDYILDSDRGIIYLVSGDRPAVKEQSVKITYTAGYSSTPEAITYVTAQVAANVLHSLLQRKISPTMRVGEWTVKMVVPECFTTELKSILVSFQKKTVHIG